MFGRRRSRAGALGSLARPAVEGEVCTCGKPAVVVFESRRIALAFGSCMDVDACERTGPCPFCGVSGRHLSGGICPQYVLRPAWATAPAMAARAELCPVAAGSARGVSNSEGMCL